MISYKKSMGIDNDPSDFIVGNSNNASELWHIIKNHTYSPIIFKNGYRKSANFLFADMCVLDVDNDDSNDDVYSVEEALEDFGDCTMMIAATRSHNKDKKGIVAPRFRILIPFESRIDCPYTYEKSIKFAMGLCRGSDPSAKDSARQFYPSTEILAVRGPGEKMPVIPATADEIYKSQQAEQYKRDQDAYGKIPWHIINFLTNGVVFGNSRNTAVYTASRYLIQRGFAIHEIEKIIEDSPFSKEGFSHAEIRTTIKSAAKKLLREK